MRMMRKIGVNKEAGNTTYNNLAQRKILMKEKWELSVKRKIILIEILT